MIEHKKTNTLVPVFLLKPGEKFEIPSLQDNMRNLKFVSSSECSSLIEGQTRYSASDEWKPFRYHISNSVRVKPVLEHFMHTQNTVEGKNNEKNLVKNSRGRPKKSSQSLDNLNGVSNTEFTIKDVLKVNDIKTHDLYKLIKNGVQNGKVKVVKEISSGRGKPAKVYKFIK